MMTLQINTSGSWKTLLQFAPERRPEILRALGVFAGVLGDAARWCLLHEDGKREWLPNNLGPWEPITAEQPAPLEDVMVSVYLPGDEEPVTYMAYRKQAGSDQFYISGTADEKLGGAFAWAPVMDPAPLAQQAAA